jgi:hypothetical protein
VARPSGRLGLRCLAHLLAAAVALACMAWLAPAAAHAAATAKHQIECVLISGRLYLGSPGAGPNPKFVTCDIRFEQVKPHSDGVIVVLRSGRHGSTYSILKLHLPQPSSRYLLRWLHRHSHPRSGALKPT